MRCNRPIPWGAQGPAFRQSASRQPSCCLDLRRNGLAFQVSFDWFLARRTTQRRRQRQHETNQWLGGVRRVVPLQPAPLTCCPDFSVILAKRSGPRLPSGCPCALPAPNGVVALLGWPGAKIEFRDPLRDLAPLPLGLALSSFPPPLNHHQFDNPHSLGPCQEPTLAESNLRFAVKGPGTVACPFVIFILFYFPSTSVNRARIRLQDPVFP